MFGLEAQRHIIKTETIYDHVNIVIKLSVERFSFKLLHEG